MSRLTALLIGNAAYTAMPVLRNAVNDARDLARVLQTCGFQTRICVDATIETMDDSFQSFISEIEEGDVALFFFAGHGVQLDGANYLMAIDTPADGASAAKYRSLHLNQVIEEMSGANSATTLIILDACRNNPWAHSRRSAPSGLAPVYAPKGTLLAFSTSPGEQADDGAGANGAYTAALLQHIGTADLPVEQMFKRVRNTLSVATGGAQTSWEHTSLSGEFYFELGVTKRITEYGATALKDSVFVPEPAIWSHALISGLKRNTWIPQNAAIQQFSLADASTSSTDDLFVLGRNILQAADGKANAAIDFIDNFMARTAGLPADKRKAILDGILFEIFFDPNGDFRNEPKLRLFNAAFALQAFAPLASSFEFISNALAPFGLHFHVVPGRGHATAIDVRLVDGMDNTVEDVLWGGRSIMRVEDPDWAADERVYRGYERNRFESDLALRLMIPQRDITITYSSGAPPNTIRYPYGYTVSRATP